MVNSESSDYRLFLFSLLHFSLIINIIMVIIIRKDNLKFQSER